MKNIAVFLGFLVMFCLFGTCYFAIDQGTARLTISIRMPPESINSTQRESFSGSRFIAPGTAQFMVTITAADLETPVTRAFTAPAPGAVITTGISGLTPSAIERSVSVTALDGTGGVVSSGSASVVLVAGQNQITILLSPSQIAETGINMDPGELWSGTLVPGQIRVHRFNLNMDGRIEYAVTIGPSRCDPFRCPYRMDGRSMVDSVLMEPGSAIFPHTGLSLRTQPLPMENPACTREPA